VLTGQPFLRLLGVSAVFLVLGIIFHQPLMSVGETFIRILPVRRLGDFTPVDLVAPDI
jgi:hypothetical protein